ncbi:MAG: ABC transporter permease subunit [Streptococcaceae bacterium]|jgi:L-cystine transport system permease protein|nr:ABC transporter permease subunit [Streptococcaceae bacterium]
MSITYLISTFLASLKGVPVTLFITFFALIVALPLGFGLALLRLKKIPVLSQLARLYTLIIRGTPLILLILLFYSFVPSFLNAFFKAHQIGIDIFKVNPLVYACAVFLLVAVAAVAEIFRSSLLAVDSGQFEAGQVTNLSAFHLYTRIILPQALVSSLPNLCNLTITLVKGTSLVFVMTVKDITAIAKIQASYGYNYAESYVVIFIIYIIVCSLIQYGFKKLAAFVTVDQPTAPKKLPIPSETAGIEKGVLHVEYSELA